MSDVKRAPDGRWLTSGNPGGQLKRVREIRKLAMEETEASFRVLFAIRDNAEEDTRNRIAACKEIIRYGIGEPPKVDGDHAANGGSGGGGDMGGLTLDELRNLARQSLAAEPSESDDDADEDDGDGQSPH